MPNKSRSPHSVHAVQNLSPDGYSRFYVMVDVIHQIYASTQTKIKILDVGGGSQYFEQELGRRNISYDLTVLDMIKKPKEVLSKYIQADASNMPLDDNSYEVVVSTDVLEHVPINKKSLFITECLRVASELCIIAGPFDTDGVNDAEIAVNNFNKQLFGSGQDWLEEHLFFGKPSLGQLTKILDNNNILYDTFGTQKLDTWLLNTQLNLIEAKLGLDHKQHINANNFYNSHITTMGDFEAPTYRQFFVIYIDSSKQSELNLTKYTQSIRDHTAIADYSSKIMTMVADRIKGLNEEAVASSLEVDRLSSELERLYSDRDSKVMHLESVIANQKEKLDKLEPIVKLFSNKVTRKIYAKVNNKSKSRIN